MKLSRTLLGYFMCVFVVHSIQSVFPPLIFSYNFLVGLHFVIAATSRSSLDVIRKVHYFLDFLFTSLVAIAHMNLR